FQAAVDGLDELVRRPGAARRAEARVVAERRVALDDLLEREAFVDQRLNLIADDRQHVAVVADVGRVGKPAVPGDDHRAAFRAELRDREPQDRIQARQHAVDAAAGLDVDDRERVHVDEVARRDDVGAAEEHEAVAVGRRVRHVDDLDAFLVEERADLVLGREERLGRQRGERQVALDHAVQHVLVREHRGAFGGIGDRAGDVAARVRHAARRDRLVAADAVRQRARVDDVADRLRRRVSVHREARARLGATALRLHDVEETESAELPLELLDRGDDARALVRGAGVDEQHAVGPDGRRDVRAGADQHPDVLAHRPPVQLAGGFTAALHGTLLRGALLLRVDWLRRGCEQADRQRQRRGETARQRLRMEPGHRHSRPGAWRPAVAPRRSSFLWYSGYIVSAPSKYSSRGRP